MGCAPVEGITVSAFGEMMLRRTEDSVALPSGSSKTFCAILLSVVALAGIVSANTNTNAGKPTVVVLVGALTFFPAILLGPIANGLTGRLF